MADIRQFTKAKVVKTPLFLRPELLLHPPIPIALHGINPRTINGKKWWDEIRKNAYAENNFCCNSCGFYGNLEAHESYKINYHEAWMELEEVVALCHYCHSYIHESRLALLVSQRKISMKKYDSVVTHGNEIVKDLEPMQIAEGWIYPPDHSDWRLKLNGKEYFGDGTWH